MFSVINIQKLYSVFDNSKFGFFIHYIRFNAYISISNRELMGQMGHLYTLKSVKTFTVKISLNQKKKFIPWQQ